LAHIDTHKGKFSRTHKCEFCDLTFSTPNALKVQLERQHGILHCKSRFTDPKEMKMHFKLHTMAQIHSFVQFAIKDSPSGQDRPLTLNITTIQDIFCNKKFGFKHHLDRHRETRLNYKRLQSSICCTMFSQEEYLQKHMKNKHSSSTEERWYCDICGSSQLSFIDLLRHSMYHIGLQPYECQICKCKCSSSQNLHLHHRLHLVPEVQCDICLKTFVNITGTEKPFIST
jgi:KRAB domain-containing zinc finger protein